MSHVPILCYFNFDFIAQCCMPNLRYIICYVILLIFFLLSKGHVSHVDFKKLPCRRANLGVKSPFFGRWSKKGRGLIASDG